MSDIPTKDSKLTTEQPVKDVITFLRGNNERIDRAVNAIRGPFLGFIEEQQKEIEVEIECERIMAEARGELEGFEPSARLKARQEDLQQLDFLLRCSIHEAVATKEKSDDVALFLEHNLPTLTAPCVTPKDSPPLDSASTANTFGTLDEEDKKLDEEDKKLASGK